MILLSKILIALTAALHLYFLWLEMFAWASPLGQKVFRKSADWLESTKGLAANQGLYNGFLAAGLLWALVLQDALWSARISIFFLSCVIVAGIFGALTVGKRIFWVQSAPAIIALLAVLLR